MQGRKASRFTPDRTPVSVEFCHNGNPRPRWEREPDLIERVEAANLDRPRLVFHMLPSHEGGTDYGANIASVIPTSIAQQVRGLVARRHARGQRTGFYVGRLIQASGVRTTHDPSRGPHCAEPTIGTAHRYTAQWLRREIEPLAPKGVRLTLWVDAWGSRLLRATARRFPHHDWAGEAWPMTWWSPTVTLDTREASAAPYWITPEFFKVLDQNGHMPAKVDPATTELHYMHNDGHWLNWPYDGTWKAPAAAIVDFHRSLRARGFIVSGSSGLVEVHRAITAAPRQD